MRQFPDPQGLNQDSKAQLQELRFLHALMQAPNTTTSACSLAIFNSSSKRRESGQGERPQIPQLATQALCCAKLITSISIRTRTDQNNLLNMLRQKRSYQLVNAKQLQNSLSLFLSTTQDARGIEFVQHVSSADSLLAILQIRWQIFSQTTLSTSSRESQPCTKGLARGNCLGSPRASRLRLQSQEHLSHTETWEQHGSLRSAHRHPTHEQ